jgi:hypothetical protein
VTRPRPSRSGRAVPTRHRSFLHLPLLIVAAIAVSACIGGEAVSTVSPAASVSPSAPAVASASPSASVPASPSAEPTATEAPVATPGTSPSASASGSPGAAGDVSRCTGSDDNRRFFADAATSVDWPVYCPVLPARWNVTTGSRRGSGSGGQVVISYKGPNGATLALQQGSFCDGADGCVAAGREVGPAAFGDKNGTLIALDDGGYALIVDRGARPSWLAIGTGLDEGAFRDIAAGFVRLD